jgi:mono/diheme cytochrome c family protein
VRATKGKLVAAAGQEPSAGQPLYRQYCLRCHDQNGTGARVRDCHPEIPDFTRAAWHDQRSDVKLRISILDGKGTGMPSFSNKLTSDEIHALTAYIRGLAPTRNIQPMAAPDEFEERFLELKEEWHTLHRQFRQLATSSTRP